MSDKKGQFPLAAESAVESLGNFPDASDGKFVTARGQTRGVVCGAASTALETMH